MFGQLLARETSLRWYLVPEDQVLEPSIALASGDVERAQAAAAELDDIAERYHSPSPALRATAGEARGRVALHAADAAAALAALSPALRAWQEVRAPYELARVRTLVARAHLLLGDRDTARLELETAATAFAELGAAGDVRATEALLEGLRAPERVTRTFMFTDVVSSTDLIDVIGDDAWADVLRSHDQTLRELIGAHGGEVANHTGDGFFVAFATADAGLACAVAIQRRLAEHRRDHGYAPRVRIGVHTTEALRESSYRGRGVHEAARIAALAESGQILASAATLEAAHSAGYPVTGRRTVTLKGVATPMEVAEVRADPAR